MKKYFIFAAIAAAGLLTSCSSSDDVVSEAPGNPIENQDEGVSIKIGVAKPTANITRGTGTVGGVVKNDAAVNNDGTTGGTPAANVWAGQTVNVYMFDKGTLDIAKFNGEDIYNNAKLRTPYASQNTNDTLDYIVPASDNTYYNANQEKRYVKYYPMAGQFDFWGYRIDDAVATPAVPAIGTDVVSTVISVDGTQDVLSGVTEAPKLANLNPTQVAAVQNFNEITTNPTEANYTAYQTAKFYSASSARGGFNPNLKFSHMMTRLTFDAYKGSDAAGDYEEKGGNTVFDEGVDVYNGVFIDSIKVRAISVPATTTTTATTPATYIDPTKGTFKIAGVSTTEEFKPSLTWANAQATPDPFILKQRAYYKRNANAEPASYQDVTALEGATTDQGKTDSTAIATAMEQEYISAATWALLNATGKGKYTAIHSDTLTNVKLIDLISNTDDHTMNGSVKLANTDADHRNAIGEAIIAPAAAAYEITICLAQRVVVTEDPTSPYHPSTPIDYATIKYNTVKAVVFATEAAKQGSDLVGEADKFKAGYSYNFRIKVYGLERIDITTTLSPWEYGGGVDVDTDN